MSDLDREIAERQAAWGRVGDRLFYVLGREAYAALVDELKARADAAEAVPDEPSEDYLEDRILQYARRLKARNPALADELLGKMRAYVAALPVRP